MRMMIGAVLVLAVAAAAPGQEQTDPGRPVEAEPDELLLAGPKVETARLPGLEESFSGGAMRMPGMGERPVPMRVFRRVFEVLRAESVDEQLRLTEEQQEQLGELGREHAQAVREHMQPYSDEIARLRRAVGPRDNSRETDAQPRRGGQDAISVLHRRLAQIRGTGPSDVSLQTRMWTVLTEPQRELVQARIEAWREEMAERRTQQEMERYMRQSRDAAPSPRDRAPMSNAGSFERQLSERLRRSIRRLAPEARGKLLERLRERWERRQRDAPAEGANPGSTRSGDRPGSGR